MGPEGFKSGHLENPFPGPPVVIPFPWLPNGIGRLWGLHWGRLLFRVRRIEEYRMIHLFFSIKILVWFATWRLQEFEEKTTCRSHFGSISNARTLGCTKAEATARMSALWSRTA